MRLWFALSWLSLAGLCSPAEAVERPSGHRFALLLGNSAYEGFTLDGVGKSLDRVEQALSIQGFRTVRREGLGADELKAAVEDFAESVPTGGVVLVYYMGLAAHVERSGQHENKHENLLRPVGETIQNDNDYRKFGLSVANLVSSLREHSGAQVSLVFLDACWDSPIKPENDNVRGGLHEFDAAGTGVVVLFAAGSGETLPTPQSDTPSALATAMAKRVGWLEDSVRAACEAISAGAATGSAGADEPWFSGASATPCRAGTSTTSSAFVLP